MKNLFKTFIGIIIIICIIALSSILFESYLTKEELKVKVIKKEKLFDDKGEVLYLIYTKDEIFRNENDKYHDKNNADQLFTRIRKGSTYTIRVVGYSFREILPYLHKYRNLIDIVDEKDKTRSIKGF